MRRLVLVGTLALTASAALAPRLAASVEAAVARATIGVVRKEHGVDLPGGRKGVRIAVPVDTSGLAGTTIATAIFFVDAAGRALPSADPAYAASDGQLRVVSADAALGSDAENLEFVFPIPYAAFPRRPGAGYQVTGQIRVFQRTAAGRVVLATSTVGFWVGA